MIGKEIADAITPIVKWLFITGGITALIILAVKKWNVGIKARDDLEEAIDTEESRKKSANKVAKSVGELRTRWAARRKRKRDLMSDN